MSTATLPRRANTMSALLVVALATAAIVLPATAAAAADEQAPTGTAVYAVEITDTSTGPGGDSEVETASGELRIACVESTCAVVAEPGRQFLGGVELVAGPALSGARSLDGTGSPCAEGHGARTVSLEATPDGFTATLDQEAVDWLPCDDGSEAYGHARQVTWSGALVAADGCVFREDGCTTAMGGSFLATGSPAAPSVLSTLATPATAGTSPVQLALAALVTIILVLLVAFPTALLNSAAEHGSGRLAQWWRTRRPDTTAEPLIDAEPGTDAEPAIDAEPNGGGAPPPRAGWSQTWWWAAVGVFAAAVVSAFVDPQFGLNPGSLRVILSITASFAIDVVVGWSVVILVMRRVVPGATHAFAFQPLTLLIVVLAVVFTRVTGFEPGIVFGLVAGVAFGALAGRAQEARTSLVTLGYAFAVALLAWVGYAMMGGGAAVGGSFWSTFLVETLSAIAIGGMAALPIALFPLRGMPGAAVWAWNKWIWAACYAVGLMAFFVVLMPMPFSWEEVSLTLSAWIGVYLVYLAVALVLWLILARPWQGRTVETPPEESGVDPAEGALNDGTAEEGERISG